MLKTPETQAAEQRLDQESLTALGTDMAGTVLVWDRVQRRLRAELGEDVYTSWFKCLELVQVQDDTVILSVPTKFLRNWIQQHFLEKITAHFQKEDGRLTRVTITMRSASLRTVPRPEASKTAEPVRKSAGQEAVLAARPAGDAGMKLPEARHAEGQDGDLQVGSPLDKRLVLGSFQVGRSNVMAHAAAMQIVQAKVGEMPVFNPLYVHASVGLGKTHLLQGAAQAIENSGRRVLYLTAERFMYGFVASLKAQ
ncbi:MAG: DnaA/Hda family protein, partial [Beijerinckiaceae bacterium]|nr:DnaA/Hda family protein [Beijerinckiaceae bacterium]